MPRRRSGHRHNFSGEFGCIATFRYADDVQRTLVATSRVAAFEQARRRWGDEWIGEPCFSTPNSILLDLKGETKRRHGDFTHKLSVAEKIARRLHREGR